MSVATLQQAPLRVKGQLAVAFFPVGQEPDLIGTIAGIACRGRADRGRRQRARFAALPKLASGICRCWPAGTIRCRDKSYIAMLSLSAIVIAHVQKDVELLGALKTLPDALRAAGKLDWSHAVDELKNVERMIVIGRGLGLAIAQEAGTEAEGNVGNTSRSVLQRGKCGTDRWELIGRGYPLLVFAPRGPEQAGLIQLARDMRARGARVLLRRPADVPEATLPLVETAHFAAGSDRRDSVLLCDGRWPGCRARRNPDAPRHLAKVTETR